MRKSPLFLLWAVVAGLLFAVPGFADVTIGPSGDYPTYRAAQEDDAISDGETIVFQSSYNSETAVNPNVPGGQGEPFPVEVNLDVNDPNNFIENLTVQCNQGATFQVPDNHAGMVVRADGTTVLGCSFVNAPKNTGEVGLVVKDVDEGVSVSDITITGLNNGLRLINADNVSANNVLVSSCNGIGVHLEQSNDNSFTNTAVTNCSEGLFLWESDDNTFDGGSFNNNDTNGVTINDSNGNTLNDLDVADNDGWGVDFSLSPRGGIVCQGPGGGTDGNTLSDSNVSLNDLGGVKLEGSSCNYVTGNNIHDNGDGVEEDIQLLITSGQKLEYFTDLLESDNDPFNTDSNDVRVEIGEVKSEISRIEDKLVELDVELEDLVGLIDAAGGIVDEIANLQTGSAEYDAEVVRLDEKMREIALQKFVIVCFKIMADGQTPNSFGCGFSPDGDLDWEYQLLDELYGDGDGQIEANNGSNQNEFFEIWKAADALGLIPDGLFQMEEVGQTQDPDLRADFCYLGQNPVNGNWYFIDTIECEKFALIDEVDNIKDKIRRLQNENQLSEIEEAELLQKLDRLRGRFINDVNPKLEDILWKLFLADVFLPNIYSTSGTVGQDFDIFVGGDLTLCESPDTGTTKACFDNWNRKKNPPAFGFGFTFPSIPDHVLDRDGIYTSNGLDDTVSISDAALWVKEAIAEKETIFDDIERARDDVADFNSELPPPPFEINGATLVCKKEQGGRPISGGEGGGEENSFETACVAALNSSPEAQDARRLATGSSTWTLSDLDQETTGPFDSEHNVIASNVFTTNVINNSTCWIGERIRGCNVLVKVETARNRFVNNLFTNEDVFAPPVAHAEELRADVGFVMLSDENDLYNNAFEFLNHGIVRGGDNGRNDDQHEHLFVTLAVTRCGDEVDPVTCQRPTEKVITLRTLDKPMDKITCNFPAPNSFSVCIEDRLVKRNDIKLNFFERNGIAIDVERAESNTICENLFMDSSTAAVIVRSQSTAISFCENDLVRETLIAEGSAALNAINNHALGGVQTFGNVSTPNVDTPFCVVENFGNQPKYVSLGIVDYFRSVGPNDGALPPNQQAPDAGKLADAVLPEEKPRLCSDVFDLPGGEAATVADFFDSEGDNDDKVDTQELLNAVNVWLNGGSVNGISLAPPNGTSIILQIVAWWLQNQLIGSSVAVGPQAASALASLLGGINQPLNVRSVSATPLSSGNVVDFTVLGTGIQNIQVRVFGLSGELVFTSDQVAGNGLRWNLLSNAGQRVANGVYLYVVTATGFNGETVTTKVSKLVVLR